MHATDVREILTDPAFDRNRRLLRLQGQRDHALEQAVAAGWVMRLGPAQCALFGTVALMLGDGWIYLALAVVSSIGVVTAHHPVEWVYVWWAGRRGMPPPPANRAPRRFACLLGATSFAIAGIALMTDSTSLFWPAAVLLVTLPAFVAATNLCVPSLLFTLVVGAERATCPSLLDALSPSTQGSAHEHSPTRTP